MFHIKSISVLHNSLGIIYLVSECVTPNIMLNNRKPKHLELYSKSSINIRHVTVLCTNMCMGYSMVQNCVFIRHRPKPKS
jgi:hypothetical protein